MHYFPKHYKSKDKNIEKVGPPKFERRPLYHSYLVSSTTLSLS